MDWRDLLRFVYLAALAVSLTACATERQRAAPRIPEKPNIIFILVDDMGYGDVQCLSPEGKIATPNMDRLPREGMMFTDAHSSSAVCTPTRYGILTGRYCWRSRLKKSVIWEHEKALIENGRLTVGGMLQQKGYATAAIGKWHLGEDWQTRDGKEAEKTGANVDYSKPFKNGPTTRGFDYFFGNAAINMAPYCFVENDRTVGIPSVKFGSGFKAPGYELSEVMPSITQKAVEYITQKAHEQKPFFLYFSLTAVHGPIVPAKEWQGKSGLTPYADFVMQTDWTVGQVLDALDRGGITDRSFVILASDNGCAPGEALALAKFGHRPSSTFRGYKTDLYEGGHRIPLLVRWPGRVKPGAICSDTVSLADFMATVPEVVGFKLPDNAAEDSVSILPALLGVAKGPRHEATVYNTYSGSLAIRKGPWKLIFVKGSGGWSQPLPGTDPLRLPQVQLYNLSNDLGESTNVQDQHPDVVKELTALMQSYVDRGRSTPGKPQKNHGVIDIYQ